MRGWVFQLVLNKCEFGAMENSSDFGAIRKLHIDNYFIFKEFIYYFSHLYFITPPTT